MSQMRLTELLAPAGDSECVRAAVANGADAVYFGLANFNARHRAANVEGESLQQTLGYLHDHNVRGYVAFNTLIFSGELEAAADSIVEIAQGGADAVIVQDLGLLHLIGLMTPTLPRHASTQMTLSDARGINVATQMGISRSILARELSIADIRRIAEETVTPLEVFCHGALCVAYSGQCLTSESIGGRSANRGQCAQACRLPYGLIVDGEGVEQDGRVFLLSPQDLSAFDHVGELVSAGVASLKIEGRLKSAQYVAATTSAYREAIDAAVRGGHASLSQEREAQLNQSFSRGFTPGFLAGANHQQLVQGVFSKKRGIEVGDVVRSSEQSVTVHLLAGQGLKPGDGVVFDEGHPEQDEQGGRIYEVRSMGAGLMELRFGRGAIVTSAVNAGATVWKTDDPAINRQLSRSYSRDVVVRRERLSCEVRAVVGEKLHVVFRDESGREVRVETDAPLERALKFPLSEQLVREQLGRLGDTHYDLGRIRLLGREDSQAPEPVMAPKSVLNDLRRRAVEQLQHLRSSALRHEIVSDGALAQLREQVAAAYPPANGAGRPGRMTVLVRSREQLEAALARPADEIEMTWCEYEDGRRYREAAEMARAAGRRFGLATMRIAKPGEDGFLKQIAECSPDAVLVRNLSAMAWFAQNMPQTPLVCDYSLNVANEISAFVLLQGIGWRGPGDAKTPVRLTPSHDLNMAQLEAMLQRISGSVFEVVVHQHMPMFHMEHCVFAHMLSNGRDFHDCGRPCEKHKVSLKDRVGVEHPLQADAGCRNTVFNGRPQSAAAYVPRLRELGVELFRVEMLQEDAQQAAALLDYYSGILAGRSDAGRPATATRLKVIDLMGVTPGTMEFD